MYPNILKKLDGWVFTVRGIPWTVQITPGSNKDLGEEALGRTLEDKRVVLINDRCDNTHAFLVLFHEVAHVAWWSVTGSEEDGSGRIDQEIAANLIADFWFEFYPQFQGLLKNASKRRKKTS